ncbi:MAG: hypothetical protein ABF553_09470 [Acetobacter orientalis]|uniref:hypothetical protein n=1 Tax=Acetobacter orientalis TaxID=146474 RepID=UPI0039EAE4CC
MSGLYLPHVHALWVQPALAALPASLNTLSAQQGVLGIGNTESAGYRYIKQIGSGPALGFWQMEPATHDDAWANFIRFRPALQTALIGLLGGKGACAQRLADTPLYAAAMCRVQLYRAPMALPPAYNATAWATFWKTYYNTNKGDGNIIQATPYFQNAMGVT